MRHLLLSFLSPGFRSARDVLIGDVDNVGAFHCTAPTTTDERNFFETAWLRVVTRATSINLLLALSGCASTQETSLFPTEYRDASPSGWLVKESAPRFTDDETEELSSAGQSEEKVEYRVVTTAIQDSEADDALGTESERYPNEPPLESQGATFDGNDRARTERGSPPNHYYLYDEGIYRVHPTALTIDPMAIIHP